MSCIWMSGYLVIWLLWWVYGIETWHASTKKRCLLLSDMGTCKFTGFVRSLLLGNQKILLDSFPQ